MADRELKREFYRIVDENIRSVDYGPEDFSEVSQAVDDYGDAGSVWLVLTKEETIDFLEGSKAEKLRRCDATESQSEKTLLLNDIKLTEDLITKVRQNQVGNIEMGHSGEINFSRRGIKTSASAEELLRYLFGRGSQGGR